MNGFKIIENLLRKGRRGEERVGKEEQKSKLPRRAGYLGSIHFTKSEYLSSEPEVKDEKLKVRRKGSPSEK
ncbi:hypothetical protein BPAE_0004g01030 [Botrytis paeoniae]|uniref:Uncharacterized protein n=1 Tax=Botrytis paeoniae TaxID=278948 RepID=A0A4Z1G1F1_9HELO|nr:hypothetical protein BPAE_0004g01030 [Botrytis paeoniae]